MRIFHCETCNKEIVFTAKSSYKRFCQVCRKKRVSQQTMLARKKRYPNIEIGVGSGRHSSNKKGLQNYNTTTGIQIYRDLIPVKECSVCGSTRHLCVHHIDENRSNNTVENLMVLCKRCHQAYHTIRDKTTGKYLAKKNDVNVDNGVS